MFIKRQRNAKLTTFIKDTDGEDQTNQGKVSENSRQDDTNTVNLLKQKRALVRDKPQDEEAKKLTESAKEKVDFTYKSSYTLSNINDACRESEIYTEKSKDKISQLTSSKFKDPVMHKGGNIVYTEDQLNDTIEKNKVLGHIAPMRVNTNFRATSRMDYSLGICKDFQRSGICGFGDDCVFMHDRGNYMNSWEIDEKIRRNENKATVSEPEEDVVDISTDCPICNAPFQKAVLTVCMHKFCEECALKHHRKKGLCFVCRYPTKGIFNNLGNDSRYKSGAGKETIDRVRSNRKTVEENGKKRVINGGDLLEVDNDFVTDVTEERKIDKSSVQGINNDWVYKSDIKSYK